jgi:proline dehydrogenase
MIREVLSSFARQSWLRKAAMSTPIVRNMAWRLVAGESQEEGLAVVRALNAKGIKGTMNFIGTHVRNEREATRAADTAVECLQRIRETALDTHLSLKLTQIGLDIDPELCRRELARVLASAHACGNFVRIDMEESAYTEETLRIFEEAHALYPDSVGIVLQSYLRRNQADLERVIALGASVRLVKGGYWESNDAAFRKKDDIDRAYLRDLESLLLRGRNPALATHDPVAIERAIVVAAAAGLAKESFEFQMLFGVREDLAESLFHRGFRVRDYVPYGTHWYEYVLGCIRRDPRRIFRSLRMHARTSPAGHPSMRQPVTTH